MEMVVNTVNTGLQVPSRTGKTKPDSETARSKNGEIIPAELFTEITAPEDLGLITENRIRSFLKHIDCQGKADGQCNAVLPGSIPEQSHVMKAEESEHTAPGISGEMYACIQTTLPEMQLQPHIDQKASETGVSKAMVKAKSMTQAMISRFSEPLTREVDSNSRVAAALLNNPELGLASETLEKLKNRPEWFGVIAGVLPAASISGNKHQIISDLHVVSHYQAMATQQNLEIIPDPTQKERWLLYNGDLLAREFPETRLQNHILADGKPGFDSQRWTPEVAEKVMVYNRQHHAEALSAISRVNHAPETRLPGPRTPAAIHMIGYVSSPHQLERFKAVLQNWTENLRVYGHRTQPLVFCDDSPEPFATELRQLLHKTGQETGLNLIYVGQAENEQLTQVLQKRLAARLSEADIEALATLLAGRGPTQNRNFSLQLLGKSGGLQIDHDMTSEILALSPQELRNDFAELHEWKKIPQGGSDKPILLSYDILQCLEAAPQDCLSSLRFCGSNDIDLRHLIAIPTPKLERSLWLSPESRECAQPLIIQDRFGCSMGGSLRSPMNVPKNFNSTALLAPQVRDGDIAVGITSYLSLGLPSMELPLYVNHRDQAGGNWGSGELLYQYKTFEMIQHCLKHWVSQAGQGPEALGKAILAGLGNNDFPSLDWTQEQWAAQMFKKYHTEAIRKLSAHIAALGTPAGDVGVEEWNRNCIPPRSQEECRQEWTQVRQRINTELERFRSLFPCNGEKLDHETIEASLRKTALPVLRTYALALIHGQEIRASFQEFREHQVQPDANALESMLVD